jgi:hypothetical protein
MLGWAVCELGFITLMPLGKGETLTYSIIQQQQIITNNNNNNNNNNIATIIVIII